MVGISSMNVIDVPSIVSKIMAADSLRSTRLVDQKAAQNAQISVYQALNTSLLQVASAAEAITSSSSWVPATVGSSDGSVTGTTALGAVSNATYTFTVDPVDPADGAVRTISFGTGGTATSDSSGTFTGLPAFPGLTFTVTGEPVGIVTLTTSSVVAMDAASRMSSVSDLVSALNSTLALLSSQTAANGALATDYTPREISQRLLNTSWGASTLASLADAGIELTKVGTFTYKEAKLSAALSGGSANQIIGQIAAFAARVEAVTTATTSITGSITREINTRQTRVSDLGQQITDLAAYLTRREESLNIYYAEINAKIQALQNQQNYLKTQLDVFTEALYKK